MYDSTLSHSILNIPLPNCVIFIFLLQPLQKIWNIWPIDKMGTVHHWDTFCGFLKDNKKTIDSITNIYWISHEMLNK